jgi:amino acid transporter
MFCPYEPDFCKWVIVHASHEFKDRNPCAFLFAIILAVGIIAFLFADATIPDADKNNTLNNIAFVYVFVLIFVGYFMVKISSSRKRRREMEDYEAVAQNL